MFKNKIDYLFFDTRALGLMRIAMALVIIIDLCIRMSDLEAFYTNQGAVPLSMVFQYSWNEYFISLHTISGQWGVQLFLFSLSLFFAVLLLIGYRTRLFTFLSWFMLVSLHNRNGLILQGGDDLLRMVMFWAIFIPWGARYSCDKLLGFLQDTQIRSIATIAYLLQICYLYSGSALLKGPEWHTEFSAVYYAYSLDQIAFPLTKVLYYYPGLLKAMTVAAYYFELCVPCLFFIPVRHALFRSLAVILIILFHFFNEITLLIGLFPAIGAATALGILPAAFMDKLEKLTTKLRQSTVRIFLLAAHGMRSVFSWRQESYQFRGVFQKIQEGILIFLVFFVFDWNFSNLSFIESKLSNKLRGIGYALRLDQSWGMFAPGVFKDDGWYVLEGITIKGEHIDLYNPGKKLTYNKPSQVTSMFKNDRWRKYTENYIFHDNTYMRGYFCNYYKRIWNEANEANKINCLRVVYVGEFTLPDYKYSRPSPDVLWECMD